ncbi:grainyhead-like [Linnemannia gamsii]|uniref:Grainyhead-like n=1 Tax=Linnemannia gamsii TaxID=64522 RepID=A0ABQ7JN39_9FUNG|nr:grainyhead-like [Linnemannia gamsii]
MQRVLPSPSVSDDYPAHRDYGPVESSTGQSRHGQNEHPSVEDTSPSPRSDNDSSLRFKATLDAQTAAMQHQGDTPSTYLNKGQFYSISIQDTEEYDGDIHSVIRITFHEDAHRKLAARYWSFWLSQRSNPKTARALDIERASSTGTVEFQSKTFDRTQFKWNGKEGAKLMIQFNCLSTDFSRIKGVKGIPLRIQIETYDPKCSGGVGGLGGMDGGLLSRGRIIERSFAKIKLFRDKGAERKNKDDQKHLEKMWDKMRGKHADTNSLSQVLASVQQVSIFWECPEDEEDYSSNEQGGSRSRDSSIDGGAGGSSGHSGGGGGSSGGGDDDGEAMSTSSSLDFFNQQQGGSGSMECDEEQQKQQQRQQKQQQQQDVDSSGGGKTKRRKMNNKKLDSSALTGYWGSEGGGTGGGGCGGGEGGGLNISGAGGTMIPSSSSSSVGNLAASIGHLTTITGKNSADSMSDGIPPPSSDLLDRDPSYIPQQRRKKPVTMLCLYIKLDNEPVYRAIYLERLKLNELLLKLCERLEIQASTVTAVYRKTTKKNLLVRVDDAMVSQMPEEQDMEVEYEFNQQDGSVNLTLKY